MSSVSTVPVSSNNKAESEINDDHIKTTVEDKLKIMRIHIKYLYHLVKQFEDDPAAPVCYQQCLNHEPSAPSLNQRPAIK